MQRGQELFCISMIFSPFYGGYIILELHCPHSPHLISFFLYKKDKEKENRWNISCSLGYSWGPSMHKFQIFKEHRECIQLKRWKTRNLNCKLKKKNTLLLEIFSMELFYQIHLMISLISYGLILHNWAMTFCSSSQLMSTCLNRHWHLIY